VHEAVPADALDGEVQRIAAALCANGPHAVRQSKRLVQDIAGRIIDESLIDDTARRIARIRASEEGREGVASFLEKRAPAWRD
jgi:methylglutaconyl-CoA hydratase